MAKFRINITLVLALHSLAILLSKFNLAREIAEDLKVALGVTVYADQIDRLAISEQQLHSLKSTLGMHRVKSHFMKIKNTVERNLNFFDKPSDMGPRRRK